MICHTVIWKYQAGASLVLQKTLENKLLDLAKPNNTGDTLGIVDAHIYLHNSPEGNNKGYTHLFVVNFIDEQSRDRYLVDKRHQAVLDWLNDHPIVEDFLAVDYEK